MTYVDGIVQESAGPRNPRPGSRGAASDPLCAGQSALGEQAIEAIPLQFIAIFRLMEGRCVSSGQ
jgi:hypothetical protein